MSFFDKVKGAINSGRDELTRQVGRFKNKKFMHGTVAVCARIAVAKSDGNFDQDEKLASREIAIALGFDPAEFGL
ncbi:TPA: tellurite resistance TerB family protein [Escherichia coli]|nr:tellurite resistance TerB family protein [Escherichia coli]